MLFYVNKIARLTHMDILFSGLGVFSQLNLRTISLFLWLKILEKLVTCKEAEFKNRNS